MRRWLLVVPLVAMVGLAPAVARLVDGPDAALAVAANPDPALATPTVLPPDANAGERPAAPVQQAAQDVDASRGRPSCVPPSAWRRPW
jgi:hypothetical protein